MIAEVVSIGLAVCGVGIAVSAKHAPTARSLNRRFVIFLIVEIAAVGITMFRG